MDDAALNPVEIRLYTPLTMAAAVRRSTAEWLHALHAGWQSAFAGNDTAVKAMDCLPISYDFGGTSLAAIAFGGLLMPLPPFAPGDYAFAFYKRRGYPLYFFSLFRRRPGRDAKGREQLDFFARLGLGATRQSAVRDFERQLAALLLDFPQ